MLKKTLLILGVLAFAFSIFFVSIFNSSAIKYPSSLLAEQKINCGEIPKVNYPLPYTGKILPDSPLWKIKALRDRFWFGVTVSPLRRAELALLFADKRLVMSQVLFNKGEYDVAISTYTKAEKYLLLAVDEEKKARSRGINTDNFLIKLQMASLKHTEVAEEWIGYLPEDIKPFISKTEIYAENSYKEAKNALYSRGLPAIDDPFNRD